jgi:hypothetical protein
MVGRSYSYAHHGYTPAVWPLLHTSRANRHLAISQLYGLNTPLCGAEI